MEVRKKILLVEGDERVRGRFFEILSGAGYRVDLAANGWDALSKINESSYDIVITGLFIPELDGISLYVNTLKLYLNLKDRFIFLADGPCADRLQGLDLEEKLLRMPVEGDDLLKSIASITGGGAGPERTPPDQRTHKRLLWEQDCRVTEKEARYPKPFASTVNISRNGAMIRYLGTPFKPGGVLRVWIRFLHISGTARVVWSMALDNIQAASGVKFSEPVPSASMVTVMQGAGAFVPPLISVRR